MIVQFSEQVTLSIVLALHPHTKKIDKTWHKIYLAAIKEKSKNQMKRFTSLD
jgi:hypothetical protein